MADQLAPVLWRAIDANGNAVASAEANWYETGTTTPLTVYSDAGLTTPHASPQVADSEGIFSQVFIAEGTAAKVVVTQPSGGATLYTIDPVPNARVSDTDITGTSLTLTGDISVAGVGGFYHVTKDADQTRNSTTTLADDSALTISLPVGRFTFEAVLFSAAGAGALKYGWTVPASTSMRWNTPQSTPALYLNETQTLTVSDTSTNGIMTELKGNVRILTAGTFALQWGQNASNAADTSVLLNSWMRLQKLE